MKFNTIGEYVTELQRRFEEVKKGTALGKAVLQTHSLQTQRIFEKGIASDNTSIGKYNSTDPLYVNPSKSPKSFSTKGKTGKSVFASGGKHKTGYFTSYKDFRSKVGRPTDKVNLVLFGVLQSNYVNSLTQVDVGKWTSGFTSENAKKARGNEDHFGKLIFNLSKKERDLFIKRNQEEYTKIMRGD